MRWFVVAAAIVSGWAFGCGMETAPPTATPATTAPDQAAAGRAPGSDRATAGQRNMRTLASYFEEHALLALEKQEKLAALLDRHEWALDLDAGEVSFDDRFTFGVQVLGTVSETHGSWLWAWANTQSALPDGLLKAARRLKDLGTADRLPELQHPSVELTRIDGHYLSMIASGVTRASAYYRGPIAGGAVFFLIFAPEIDRQPGFDRQALERVLTYLITTHKVKPRDTLVAYLSASRLPWREDGPSLRFRLASGERVSVEFFLSGAIKSWGVKKP